MGDEDMAQCWQRDLGLDEFEADPIAGVDEIRHAIVDDQIGRRRLRVAGADRGAAASAQQDQAIAAELGCGLLACGLLAGRIADWPGHRSDHARLSWIARAGA